MVAAAAVLHSFSSITLELIPVFGLRAHGKRIENFIVEFVDVSLVVALCIAAI